MRNLRSRSSRSAFAGLAVGGALSLIAATALIRVTPADAVVGGSATADAVDVNLVFAAPLVGLGVTGGTAAATAPAANGTNSSGGGVSASVGTLASASTSVVDASATRGVSSLSASSDINSTGVSVFGINVVAAGVITSDVLCPLVGTTTASASAADVSIGAGPAVDLSTSGTVSTSGDVAVTHALLSGVAMVHVVATTESSTTATTAHAVGLRLTLSITSGTLLLGLVPLAGTALGSVVLAETDCTSPTAADPSSILTIVPNTGTTAGGTPTTITGSGFTGATGVNFDALAGTSFVVVNDTTITVTTPPGAVGPADVLVIDAAGNGSLPGGFTYTAGTPSSVLSIVPNSGPTTGGTLTSVSGSGFFGATGVTFDGAPGTSFTVLNDTTISVTTPAGALGPADVLVIDAAGNGSLPAGFTYTAPPQPSAVLTIVPDNGPTTGGTPTTITGTGFTGATGVTFDGAPGTSFVVNNDTTITVTTPVGTAGPANVVVVDPAGNGSLPNGFTYTSAASVLTIVPNNGLTTGGTPTTITGTGFLGATSVTFDAVAGTSFVVVNDTTITVTTPAGAVGPADVLVIDAAGNGSLPAGFTYTAVPQPSAILSILPTSGPTAGGTPTTITGTGFNGATSATFDGAAGTSFVVVNDTTITVTTPPGAEGPANVVVVDAAGNGSLPSGFTYTSVASVLSIVPNNGPTVGGTPTTITGTGFLGATGVTFDGAPGTSFVVVNDTTITVTTPAGTPGPANVLVLDPAGNGSLPNGFTYTSPASVLTIVPNMGTVNGGTMTTITGTGFTGATSVTFDGTSGFSFVVVNDTTITVGTPPNAFVGPVDVVVVDAAGNGTLPNGFTYTDVPQPSTVYTIVPNSGPTVGGTATTLTGFGFTGATSVTFDGVAGTSFVIVNDSTITVTTPPGALGPAHVVVVDAAGNALLPNGFTYVNEPSSILSIVPNSGPTVGGTPVTITGSGFTDATGVTFDGVPGTSFIVVNDTTITVTTPPGAAGPANVLVNDVGGNGSLPNGYTYTSPASILSVNPSEGPDIGGTPVTITGTGFTGATGVTFDGVPGTSFTVVNDTTITVTTPPGSGLADVLVIDAAGNGSLPNGFLYLAELPETGASTSFLTTLGILLLLAGIVMRVLAGRRRPAIS